MLSWASKTGPNSKVAQIKTRKRFMGGKAANLNSVLENQDSDLHQELAFSDTTDTIDALYVQISDGRKVSVAPQIPARSRIDFITVSASNISRDKA